MKAIITKFHGPGNVRGSRISARAEGLPKVTVPYDHALNSEENHRKAAEKLVAKMKWQGAGEGLCSGALPDGKGYAFVFASGCKRK